MRRASVVGIVGAAGALALATMPWLRGKEERDAKDGDLGGRCGAARDAGRRSSAGS